jgi:predicted nucleic acid-binding protein
MAFRAVLDTNVILAAHHTLQPGSPNSEILTRWEAGEFMLLHSPDVLAEYAAKLISTGIPLALATRFLARVIQLGQSVRVEFFHLRHYPEDADDIAFLLCALNGNATHLVTYDPHLHTLQPNYDLAICEPLAFLAALRLPP